MKTIKTKDILEVYLYKHPGITKLDILQSVIDKVLTAYGNVYKMQLSFNKVDTLKDLKKLRKTLDTSFLEEVYQYYIVISDDYEVPEDIEERLPKEVMDYIEFIVERK